MIYILLLVIIVILAPWVLGLLIGAAALYGTWILVVAGVSAVALVLIGVALVVRALFFPKETAADRLAASNRAFNRKYLADAQAARASRDLNVSQSVAGVELPTRVEPNNSTNPAMYSPKTIECPHCAQLIAKGGLFCPHCGKDPKKIH